MSWLMPDLRTISQFSSYSFGTKLTTRFLELAYATVVNGLLVLFLLWLILYWMYKKKIFIKI